MPSDQEVIRVSNSEHLQAHQIRRNYNRMNPIDGDAIYPLQPVQRPALRTNKTAVGTQVRHSAA
jgi:hypothetical protein